MSYYFNRFNKFFLIFFLSLSFFNFQNLNSLIVDATSTVTLWTVVSPSFPEAATNAISGFSAVESGFILETADSTCTFSAFFPISGDLNLNGGTLYLQRDLHLATPLDITSVGKIYGNNHSIYFASSIDEIDFPDTTVSGVFSLIDSKNLGLPVNSLDWSYCTSYLAICTNYSASNPELNVYYFDGSSLTLTAYNNVSSKNNQHAYSVGWNYAQRYLAIGMFASGGATNELQIFYLNVSNGTFSQTDVENAGASVNSVAWHPTADYLVTSSGTVADAQLHLSGFSAGVVTGQYDAGITVGRGVQNDSISWEGIGQYFSAGFDTSANGSELAIFQFDGSTITSTLGSGGDLNISTSIGANVLATDWSPTGSYIAVGVDGGSCKLQIFYHDVTNGTLTKTTQIAETSNVNAVQWCSCGNSIFVGLDADGGTEIRRYDFKNSSENSSHLKNPT